MSPTSSNSAIPQIWTLTHGDDLDAAKVSTNVELVHQQFTSVPYAESPVILSDDHTIRKVKLVRVEPRSTLCETGHSIVKIELGRAKIEVFSFDLKLIDDVSDSDMPFALATSRYRPLENLNNLAENLSSCRYKFEANSSAEEY